MMGERLAIEEMKILGPVDDLILDADDDDDYILDGYRC